MYNRMSDTPAGEAEQNYPANNPPAPVANPNVQPVANNVQQTVFVQTRGVTRYDMSTRAFVGLGIAQIVLGVSCIIMQIIYTVASGIARELGTGFWTSVFFIIAGSFGIAAGKNKTFCLTVTCMVMSIISATACAVLFSLSVIAALIWHNEYYYYYNRKDHTRAFAAAVILCVLAVVEAVVAIVHAALCCRAVCCGQNRSQPMVAYVPNNSGQVMGPVVIVQNPVMAGTSAPVGASSAPAPQKLDQAGELPPKTPPPGYEENPNFRQ